MIIRITDFKGTAPAWLAEKLPMGMAQAAVNCVFGSGGLKAVRQVASVVNPAKTGVVKSIYPYGDVWFHWLEDVDCCRSAIAADGFGRVYWTGEGVPKMTVNSIATAGGNQYPTNSRTLGLPRPGAPTVTLVGLAGGDPAEFETRAYVVVFVSAYGELSSNSPPTAVVSVDPVAQSVLLTNLPTAPTGAYEITAKQIYRSATGSANTAYQLVATVDIAVGDYTDNVATADLGGVLVSQGYLPPNPALTGLISCPGGFLAGYYGNVLCFSEPGLPHAWPAEYQIVTADNIVAIGAYGSSILVTTTGLPMVVTGNDPTAMSIEYLETGEACLGKRGFVDMGYACAYPGASGLWLAGTGGVELVTKGLFDRAGWQALRPGLLLGTEYEQAYVGFYDSGSARGAFILDRDRNLSWTDVHADAKYYDRETGRLYLFVNGEIVEWCGGTGVYQLAWKSGKIVLPVALNFAAARVLSQAYPLTLNIYADGALRSSTVVSSAAALRLPGGFRGAVWELEIIGGDGVYDVALAPSMPALLNG